MNAAKLIDRFHLLGDAPAIVEQLRKLIVVLAVGGKFASAGLQGADPSLLLEELNKRRCSLTKGVGLRKQELPVVTPEDLPVGFSNPKQFVRLAYIARIEKGPTGIQKAQPGPYPLVVTAAERLTCDHYDFEGAAALIPLVSSTGHGNASLNRLHYQEGRFALGSILAGIFPYFSELYSARFLFEYLTAFKEELLVSRMTGTANVTLTIGRIADVPVPLLHPVTQRQVEELMELCDQLEAARDKRESRRDRLVAGSLQRLNTPNGTDEGSTSDSFRTHARFVFDNLPRLTTRPAHIKQLRQTILNLAVRGKLVAQDPNDEPASELLKKIQSEKVRLAKEGKIRKQPSLAPIDHASLPFPVPTHWEWCLLKGLGVLSGGMTPSKNQQSFWDGDINWFSPKDIKSDELVGSELKISAAGLEATGLQLYRPGCLFMVARSGILKRVFPVSINRVAATVNQDLKVLTPFIEGIERYLQMMFWGMQDFILSTLVKTGTTVQSLKYEEFELQPFPIPPFAEQHRIVAKVDELMALCDRLESQLTTNESDSRRLLEAVLHEALEETNDAA